MFESILIVCTANVCRSPLAEVIFKTHLPNLIIASAGTHVQPLNFIGMPADKNSVQLAVENGLNLEHHRARQLDQTLAEQYDLILSMSPSVTEEISLIAPNARSKTLLIGQWIGQSSINDPYKKDYQHFNNCYRTLLYSAKSWASKLN